jgi:hypothetical protein
MGYQQYLEGLLDPWGACGLRLPNIMSQPTSTAKPKADFTIVANTTYALFIFDPAFCSNTGQGAFAYVPSTGNATLNGATTISGTTAWVFGPQASVPNPPANTFDKVRLVSAAMKVTLKASALNLIGTAFTCISYGNLPFANINAVANSTVFPDFNQYGNFSNILSGIGGRKYDLVGENCSFYMNWYPMDPIAETFMHLNDELFDSASDEVGAFQKFVVGLSNMPSGQLIDIELVWNWETLCNGSTQQWISSTTLNAPTKQTHEKAKQYIADNIQQSSSLQRINLSDLEGDFLDGELHEFGNMSIQEHDYSHKAKDFYMPKTTRTYT